MTELKTIMGIIALRFEIFKKKKDNVLDVKKDEENGRITIVTQRGIYEISIDQVK